jgi:hypothetical protein
MGNEVKCRVRSGKQESEGKALLETSEMIFRGDFRLKIPFATILSAKVVGDELQLRTAEGVATFELGASIAQKWREKIRASENQGRKTWYQAGNESVVDRFRRSG